jgi:hypothetical protein
LAIRQAVDIELRDRREMRARLVGRGRCRIEREEVLLISPRAGVRRRRLAHLVARSLHLGAQLLVEIGAQRTTFIRGS